MSTNRENIACRPGTTDEIQRLADENEALRAERDEALARCERLRKSADLATSRKSPDGGYLVLTVDFDELRDIKNETPAQSVAHIRAAGAREALERAMEVPGFSGTVVRVDLMREIIEQMEGES